MYVKTSDGRKKLSVWVWIIILITLLGISLALIYAPEETGLSTMSRDSSQPDAAPMDSVITDGITENSLDPETNQLMEDQLRQETAMNNGYLDPTRETEIREKYALMAESKKSNFTPSIGDRLKNMDKPDEKVEDDVKPGAIQDPGLRKTTTYKTFAERLAEQSENGNPANNPQNQPQGKGSFEFGKPTVVANTRVAPGVATTAQAQAQAQNKITNILPLGTFIPCALDGDVITNTLQSHVWANVVVDVTFRRQLQLPKGLVRLRGTTASEPVQNVVDIVFDTMVFSDGTELPISGFAYSAFDPRYPHRFRTRGIPGEMILPPMWVKAQALIYTAALGASDAYVQDQMNRNNQQVSQSTPIPIIDPTTGNTTFGFNQQQNQENANLGQTLGLGFGQSALSKLVDELLKDLEKYKPYVIVEKGTPFFVQLDQTVNVDARQINGTAIAREAQAQRNQAAGIAPTAPVYAPGDARAGYTGYAPSAGSPNVPTGPNMNDGVIPPAPASPNGNSGAVQEIQKLLEMQNLLNQTQPQPQTQTQPSGGQPAMSVEQIQALLQSRR